MTLVFEKIGFNREWLTEFDDAKKLADTDTMKAHFSDEIRLSKCEELLKQIKPKAEAVKPTKKDK